MMTVEEETRMEEAYAEWLCNQPEAMICNGHMLTKRMEQQWGYEEFERHYMNPQSLEGK